VPSEGLQVSNQLRRGRSKEQGSLDGSIVLLAELEHFGIAL